MCACKKGYLLADDYKKCIKAHPCDTKEKGGCSQICNKEKGKYKCACEEGFKLAPNKKSCLKGELISFCFDDEIQHLFRELYYTFIPDVEDS